VAIAEDEDVARLDVAMDDPVLVGIVKPVAHLLHEQELVLEEERPALGDHLLELLALEELHHDEQVPVHFGEVVDGDDVGVAQPRTGLGLPEEARAQLVGDLDVARDDLERDHAVEDRVVRLENRAHAPAPDALEDPVLADLLRHRRRR